MDCVAHLDFHFHGKSQQFFSVHYGKVDIIALRKYNISWAKGTNKERSIPRHAVITAKKKFLHAWSAISCRAVLFRTLMDTCCFLGLCACIPTTSSTREGHKSRYVYNRFDAAYKRPGNILTQIPTCRQGHL